MYRWPPAPCAPDGSCLHHSHTFHADLAPEYLSPPRGPLLGVPKCPGGDVKSWSLAKRPAPSLQPCWAWLSLWRQPSSLDVPPFLKPPTLGGWSLILRSRVLLFTPAQTSVEKVLVERTNSCFLAEGICCLVCRLVLGPQHFGDQPSSCACALWGSTPPSYPAGVPAPVTQTASGWTSVPHK